MYLRISAAAASGCGVWWMTPKEIRTAAGTGDFNPPDAQTRMLRELESHDPPLVEHNGKRGGSKWRATPDALTR